MSRYDVPNEPTAEQLKANYTMLLASIAGAAGERTVRLVAVSKTKSPACLRAVYAAGQRVFGENYVQELTEKAQELADLDIDWHFIGHLQSNKVKELLSGAPGLSTVQSVDSAKLADKLNEGCSKYREEKPLCVYLQVNTSGEESKSGTEPGADTVALARHIAEQCPLLRLGGLMTIGMPDYTSRPENFECLIRCRGEVAEALGRAPEELELSMGMSGDYLNAIKMGATTVRVGSTLFGARYYPPKAVGDGAEAN